MPIHDWTRVDAGLFHHFHQQWTNSLCNALNAGGLPSNYFALVEQRIRGPIPDVLTLKLAPGTGESSTGTAGLAVATAPPRARLIRRSEAEIYAGRANRLTDQLGLWAAQPTDAAPSAFAFPSMASAADALVRPALVGAQPGSTPAQLQVVTVPLFSVARANSARPRASCRLTK